MKIKIISVGNTPPKFVRQILNGYTSKLGNHLKIEFIEIKANKNSQSIEQKKLQEAKKILKYTDTDYIISLDENGSSCSSKNFSKKLSNWMQNLPNISFIIGGADGLHKTIKENSNWIWSLSDLTIPHNIVKIILIEQLYRASTILNHHPYHRE